MALTRLEVLGPQCLGRHYRLLQGFTHADKSDVKPSPTPYSGLAKSFLQNEVGVTGGMVDGRGLEGRGGKLRKREETKEEKREKEQLGKE